MSNKKLLQKLKTDPKFLPYNENYDFKHVLNYLKEVTVTEDCTHYKHNALNSIFFNKYYQGFKEYLYEIIDKSKLSKETFLEVFITLCNRNLYLLGSRVSASKVKLGEVTSYDEIVNTSFRSNIPEFGDINAQGALEASHDGLNAIMNATVQDYPNNHNFKINSEILEDCARLFGFSNISVVIKSAYDTAIWENYAIEYNRTKEVLKVKLLEENKQFLNRIGEYRLERNIFSSKSAIISGYHEKNAFYGFVSSQARKKRRAKRLKSVEVIGKELKFKLGSGIDQESIFKELLSFSSLTTYYGFIRDEKLPKFRNISLYDVFLLFTEAQHLFEKAFHVKKEESDDNIGNFNLYRMKIKRYDLHDYLRRKTKFTNAQINQVLNLFVHKGGYYNVWERPLIEINSFLHPIMLPLLHPNTLRLLDYWLEEGGFDLDSRGDLFEKHIEEVIMDSLERKGYEVNIPKESIWRNKKEEFEEIDLIVELKNTTIIAEVKCIKYPFDPRDYSNMYSRLEKGAKQIKRKTEFIRQNKQNFQGYSCFEKPLISLVITNYPIFSGYNIDGVPIVDFSLIENYIISGVFGKGRMKATKNSLEIDNSFHSEIRYFKNEDELSNNIRSFFNNPIPIKEKLNDVSLDEMQLSLPEAQPKIIMDYVKFKQGRLI